MRKTRLGESCWERGLIISTVLYLIIIRSRIQFCTYSAQALTDLQVNNEKPLYESEMYPLCSAVL